VYYSRRMASQILRHSSDIKNINWFELLFVELRNMGVVPGRKRARMASTTAMPGLEYIIITKPDERNYSALNVSYPVSDDHLACMVL